MSAASASRVTGILAPPTCYGTPSSGGSPSVACSTTSARRAPRSWPRDSRASSPTVLAAAADGVRSARPHPSGPDPLRPLRGRRLHARARLSGHRLGRHGVDRARARLLRRGDGATAHGLRVGLARDRKSTRLNSSHVAISYAVVCLKKKKRYHIVTRAGEV